MGDEKNFVVITVSGKDGPGITAAFTRILVHHNVEIVDIDQATLQDFLGLSFLLDMSRIGRSKDSVLKDLLFEASRLDMALSFQLLSEKEIADKHDKNMFVLTFFGDTRALAEISTVLGEEHANIEKITNVNRRTDHSFELTIDVRSVSSPTRLKERLMATSHELNIDLALQKLEAFRKSKRLVFFDMDRTLVDTEIIDEMARAASVYREVSRITEKAMRGDIDFEDSLRQRVALMKGLPIGRLDDVRRKMKISEGAPDLVATLKRLGYTLGVVSGGFDFFADHLREIFQLDFAYANRLEWKNGVLTGRLVGDIVDGAEKAKILNRVSRDLGVMLDQTVAIGDGANDRLMLGQAGLGIAYNAPRTLARSASMNLGRTRLTNILYILGITEEDLRTQRAGISSRRTRPKRRN